MREQSSRILLSVSREETTVFRFYQITPLLGHANQPKQTLKSQGAQSLFLLNFSLLVALTVLLQPDLCQLHNAFVRRILAEADLEAFL